MEVVPEAGAALGRVECVAPLLRGLKLAGDAGGPAVPGEVECVAPLLRGLKRGKKSSSNILRDSSSNALPRY